MDAATLAGYAWVALGANLPHGQGNPADTLHAALPELQALSAAPLRVSAFYESDPKDCPPGSPQYINAVVGLLPKAGETPETLLEHLLAIEQHFGRVRSGVVNEARTLDLDLLAFADTHRDSQRLTLPHPRAHERRFVLEPWLEIAGGDWLLQGVPLATWLQKCREPELRPLPSGVGSGLA